MKMNSTLIFILIIFLCFFINASVKWTENGVAICTAAYSQESLRLVSDGSGGAIITWQDNRSGNWDIYAQRIDSSGAVQWTDNGVAICTAAYSQESPRLVSDGSGGTIITWQDTRSGNWDIYAQRIDSSGALQWTENGVAICIAKHFQRVPQLISVGSGGAIITWSDERKGNWNSDIYAQRINSNGAVQWTENGVAICTAGGGQRSPQLISDGSGGAIITWSDERKGNWNSDIYAQRINTDGIVQWAANGVTICNAADDQGWQQLISDGTGGAIITWYDERNGHGNSDIYAQRIDSSGTIQWAANGVAICTAENFQGNIRVISDGSGGAIITWYDRRSGTDYDIYVQRIDSSGDTQWAANGVTICNAADDQGWQQLISDGTGGAIITWHDERKGYWNSDIYAQRINSDGSVQWIADGVAMCNASNNQYSPYLISDGSGGAIITWEDYRSGNSDIYAQSIFFPTISGNAGVSRANLRYNDGGSNTVTADRYGNYSFDVSYNWSGTVTPSRVGYKFTPPRRSYTNLTSHRPNQNYIAVGLTYTISGTVTDGINPFKGVTITFSHDNHTKTTDSSGNYTYEVPYGTTTTITPSHSTVFSWSPTSVYLSNIVADHPNQNFQSALYSTCTISGTVTFGSSVLENVTMNGLPGSPATDASGFYSATVSSGWSGTVTPYLTGYGFSPGSIEYSNVTSSMPNQNYSAYSVSPEISLNRTKLNFGANTSGTSTSAQSFLIENSGGGTLNWTVTTDQTWLKCDPSSGVNSGLVSVSIDVTGLSTGTYKGTITVSDSAATNSPQTIIVNLKVYSSTDAPFGDFSTPVDGSTVSSNIPVTGWALDDIEIKSVKIFRKKGKSLYFIGDAVFVVGARPDVELIYPYYPKNYQAGWGYMMLTNLLPNGGNGTYTIEAIAFDAEGNEITLGTKTIIVDNENAFKPFGTIDTPEQGGTASGNCYVNWGWVLTPQPNHIPFDGSTINVYVDGVNLGNPTYNIYRQDIANAFPSYANSDGAVGRFYLDTTVYENGVHTIQWTATDNAGNTDGIGSRFFTIQNLAGSTAQMVEVRSQRSEVGNQKTEVIGQRNLSQIPVDFSQPVKFKKGYNPNANLVEVYPDDKGKFNIEIIELEHIEIHLQDNHSSPRFYTGYLLIDGKLNPLPIGSTFDIKRGIFYWQPGAGFLGEYQFIFLYKGLNDEIKKRNFIIKILPKFSK